MQAFSAFHVLMCTCRSRGTLAEPFLSECFVALRVHNTDFGKRWFISHRTIRVPKKPTWHLHVGPQGPLPGDLRSSGACHMHAVLGLWGHWQVDVSSAFPGSQPSGTDRTDPCEMLQTTVSRTVYKADPGSRQLSTELSSPVRVEDEPTVRPACPQKGQAS